MGKFWTGTMEHLKCFSLAEKGSAAVEFALILPIMLLVYVGSIEASTLITMDRKVQSVAGTVGDLVARSNGKLQRAVLAELFEASSGIMSPYPVKDLKQIVTQVWVPPTGDPEVVWSEQFVDGEQSQGTDYLEGDDFNLADAMEEIARGHHVIVAEASYTHEPLSGLVYNSSFRLYRQNFFMPRFGGDIDIE